MPNTYYKCQQVTTRLSQYSTIWQKGIAAYLVTGSGGQEVISARSGVCSNATSAGGTLIEVFKLALRLSANADSFNPFSRVVNFS